MLDRYNDRMDTLKNTEREISTLQHLLSNHSRQNTLKDVLNIHKVYTSIELSINAVECIVEADLRSRWIDAEEYEVLMQKLEVVKNKLEFLM